VATLEAGQAFGRVPPISLCGTRVYRLGGLVELDGRLSWAPAGARGWQPANCYLMLGSDGAVLIDTGLRLHAPAIVEQLNTLLPRDLPLSIILTRTEMDCCLNIETIEAARSVQTIIYTGGITVPRAHADVYRVNVEEGQTLEMEAAPGLRIQLVAPRLRLLPTLWPYDPQSEVLFTSDSFGHARCEVDLTRLIISARSVAAVDVEVEVIQQLRTKFAWLASADPAPVARDLIQIFDSRCVRTLAPTHGRMFQGEAVTNQQRDLLVNALFALPG
jgi:flavorubredoxin